MTGGRDSNRDNGASAFPFDKMEAERPNMDRQ
jgi:hypothetical protein